MSTNIALQRNAAVAAALAAADSFSPSGKAYMKINANTGIYTYGKDQKEIPAGSELAINMQSFALGWICWKDDEVVEEIMARPFAGEIPVGNESDLPDHGPYGEDDGWSKQASVDAKILDTGEDVQMKMSSGSGVSAMNRLLREYAKEVPQKGDDAVIVIALSSNPFIPKNPKHGKKFAPVFTIVEWTTESKLSAAFPATAEEDDEASYTPAPQAALAAPVAPVAAPVAPVAAPVAPVATPVAAPVAPVAAEVAPVAPVAAEAPAAPGGRRRRF